tara:strand:+ start:939 stop:1403 length:465 start_codon:yes stop_codon:yes gene_type:complete
MVKGNKLVTDNLNNEEKDTLQSLLNLIIPSSEDGKMPSAAEVGFINYLDQNKQITWIKEGLLNIIEESQKKYGKNFKNLSSLEQSELIDNLRRRFLRFFNHLTTEVIKCYYQNDTVLDGIGVDTRPPFPNGQILEEGDLSLLEPVYLRGKIYRD